MRCNRLAAVLTVCGLAAAAVAQNQVPPASPGVTAKQPGEASEAGQAGPSIVERTPEGRLKRLEVPPEERAVEVMDLEPAERERVQRVLAERHDMLDEIVLKNFELVSKMHAAASAGDAEEARRISGMFIPKLERFADRGHLEDELRPELRLDHQEEFTKIITRYRNALLQELIRESREEGKELKPQFLADREMRRSMAHEVERSYERMIVGTPVNFDEALSGLGVSAEQESRARTLAAEFARAHPKPTEAERRELLMQVLAGLEPDQRWALVKRVRKG